MLRSTRRRHQGATVGGAQLFSSLGLIAGDPFTVAPGATVTMDISTPSLGYTDISGTVVFQDATLTLTTTGINVANGGVLQLGTESVPLTTVTTISLTGVYDPAVVTGVNTNITNDGVSRGIMVQPGGTLDMHGTPPSTLWTTLNDHAAISATSLTLATSPGWASGTELAIAHTDFVDEYHGDTYTEQINLSAPTSGTSATISSGLARARWGKLQYPLDTAVSGSAMSLTPGTFTQAHADVPTVLDERARVFNLTRNIVVSCPSDTSWLTQGHGVHIMWMAATSGATVLPLVRIEGVQIRRGGQRGMLGRYPFHAHMNSYRQSTGAFTADTPLNYVKKCVVWESENRAYTIHGTCGMTVNDNIGYGSKGHAFFLEDGSERRNNMYRNSMVRIRPPARGTGLLSGTFVSMSGNGSVATVNWTGHGLYNKQSITPDGSASASLNYRRVPATVVDANTFTYPSTFNGAISGGNVPTTFRKDKDQIKIHDSASSGFWITNMDNKNVDNYASDAMTPENVAYGSGMWCALGVQCLGASSLVAIAPYTIDIDVFSGFTGHSNFNRGIFFSSGPSDDEGNTSSPKYAPASGGFQSTDHKLWKNALGGYFNFVAVPTYLRWTTADNGGLDFEGSTNVGGLSKHHLMIGTSLNNLIFGGLPETDARTPFFPRAGFATYHGTVRFQDFNAINFPASEPVYAGFTNNGRGFAGGVMPGGSDFYDEPGISLTHGANTNIRMSNSHPGWMVPPLHLDGFSLTNSSPLFIDRSYSIASVWQDLDGKYGTAGKFMLPFTHTNGGARGGGYYAASSGVVDDFFLSGATNLADGPTTGTVVCKTTDTRYFGLGWSDSMIHGTSDTIVATFGSGVFQRNRAPIRFTRQHLTTGATIGTVQTIADGRNATAFGGYHASAIQKGARYSIDFVDGTINLAAPSSYFRMDICNANTSGDYVLLGFPWANASTSPQVAFGHGNGSDPELGSPGYTTFPDAADVAANRARFVTTAASGASVAAKIAAVLADTTGATYFHDTSAARIWVRWTAGPYVALPSSQYPDLYDVQTIYVKYP